ncbi:MAG: PilZ domain-containing protein [Desulfobacula sp.]|nr:PilZ domain-containing protein [Desulfobacula sp.]
MNSQSIEFQKIKEDTDSRDIVRNSFRVPIENMDNIFLVANKIQYAVFDISPGGIGIRPDDNSAFALDEIIEKCELHIFGHLFENLKARIVHCSLGIEMTLQCGIQWINLDRQSSDQINKIILKMKDEVLK